MSTRPSQGYGPEGERSYRAGQDLTNHGWGSGGYQSDSDTDRRLDGMRSERSRGAQTAMLRRAPNEDRGNWWDSWSNSDASRASAQSRANQEAQGYSVSTAGDPVRAPSTSSQALARLQTQSGPQDFADSVISPSSPAVQALPPSVFENQQQEAMSRYFGRV